MKLTRKRHLAVTLFTLTAAGAHAQPVHDEAVIHEDSPDLELYPAAAQTIWSVPAAHGFEWVIEYDRTPLTFDDAGFDIQLVNTSRAVRTPWTTDDPAQSVVYELTTPSGERLVSKPEYGAFYINQWRKPGDPIETDKLVFHLSSWLYPHFGELEAGEHTLVVHVDTAARLETVADERTLQSDFKISTPPMKFDVVEREIPGLEPGEGYMLGEDGRRQLLTNPFDEPISIGFETTSVSADSQHKRRAYITHGRTEQLTDSGWIPIGVPGYCGVGVTYDSVTIKPGETVAVGAGSGITGRCVIRSYISVQRADGSFVNFYTKGKLVQGLSSPFDSSTLVKEPR